MFDFPYTSADVTQEVNRLPNEFGLINSLGLFPIETLGSRYVRVDYSNGQIHVLSAEQPGSPGSVGGEVAEGGVILQIPHFPHLEKISVGDVDGLLQVFNGQVDQRSVDRETARKLDIIRRNHSITLEYIRLGALNGLIKDGKGTTLYNLYTVFGITKPEVDFVLGTAETDVRAKCEAVVDHIMTKLQGETTSGVEAVVDSLFFNKLITHAKVEKFWLNAQNSSEHRMLNRESRAGNWGRTFEFGDIIFREYKGGLPVRSTSGAITTAKNVADNSGTAYPTGTQSMMRTFEAPVYHIDLTNQAPDADTIYISVEPLKHGQGVEMLSQTNRLAVNKQPECAVQILTSN
ncbi:hypothetical protein LL06_00760 [Hoeflea sp. BAL378]|uniref:major capsid protein n=1 Tax=Hoeflea sp. BAL378 TaxID=1547437 RepID=UPI0005137BE8|nr:major capsid protein [Hoeflea sp. BAL378]KGF71159.1 hypothetical protein LL06_00760 [Hoeflea sp. BAL378]